MEGYRLESALVFNLLKSFLRLSEESWDWVPWRQMCGHLRSPSDVHDTSLRGSVYRHTHWTGIFHGAPLEVLTASSLPFCMCSETVSKGAIMLSRPPLSLPREPHEESGKTSNLQYSPLCYTAGPCVSILHSILCICSCQTPYLSPLPSPLKFILNYSLCVESKMKKKKKNHP